MTATLPGLALSAAAASGEAEGHVTSTSRVSEIAAAKKTGSISVRVTGDDVGRRYADLYVQDSSGSIVATRTIRVARGVKSVKRTVFKNLAPGTYRVGLEGRGRARTVTVKAGATSRPAALSASTYEGYRIVAAYKSPKGWGQDGPEAFVCDRFNTCTEASSHARSGEMWLNGVAKGKYTLYTKNLHDLRPVVFTRTTVTARHWKSNKPLKKISVLRSRTLTVKVQDQFGKPVDDAQVELTWSPVSQTDLLARTGADGFAVLKAAPRTPYSLAITDPMSIGFDTKTKRVKAGSRGVVVTVTVKVRAD